MTQRLYRVTHNKPSKAGKWSYKVQFNAKSTNWRERIAELIRFLAGCVDGRQSLTVQIITRPAISSAAASECVLKGLEHATRLIASEVQEAARTRVMREQMPALFDGEEE